MGWTVEPFISDQFAHFFNLNLLRASKRSVAHHYNLTDALFASFLKPQRQYSCGYFSMADNSLEEAQVAKLARRDAKLNLQPCDRVLDIGCSWGGLAAAMMECQPDVHVTGITLSDRQLVYVTNTWTNWQPMTESSRPCEITAARPVISTRSYQLPSLNIWDWAILEPIFWRVRELLNAGGIAVIHSISVHGTARPVNRWLRNIVSRAAFWHHSTRWSRQPKCRG